MKNTIILLSIIYPLIFFTACSKNAGPIQGEITFITGKVKINNIDAVVGGKVSKDDILLTGERSEAVIQISETAVITLRSDTEMKFENLLSNKDTSETISLKLEKGVSVHKIMKKGTAYSVTAPTAVASVRGTSFEFETRESKTLIKVDSGTVYVRIVPGRGTWEKVLTDNQNNGIEDIILTAGQSLELASNGTSQENHSGYNKSVNGKLSRNLTEEKKPVNRNDSTSVKPGKENTNKSVHVKSNKTIRKTDKVKTAVNKKSIAKTVRTELAQKNKTVSKNTGKPLPGDAKSDKIISSSDQKEKAPDPAEVKKLMNKKKRNLEEIKNVYNRIDKIYLYSGEIITGAIIERGDVYSIMLTDGIIKVSKKDIQSSEIIR